MPDPTRQRLIAVAEELASGTVAVREIVEADAHLNLVLCAANDVMERAGAFTAYGLIVTIAAQLCQSKAWDGAQLANVDPPESGSRNVAGTRDR